jgi:hypothetical protein
MRRTTCVLMLIVAFVVLAAEAPVQAYLDPGAGSILLQVVLGGMAAVGVLVRLFWRSLADTFWKRDPEDKGHA